MACNPLIHDDFRFPRAPDNRPGLPRIAWRIGRYPDFVEAMVRRIDAEPALAGWTHRDADDPGIALLQGAAVLADILSFYQEHYANEAFLRTAAWRQSVADLVRLTGYRLAPGIGGRATFAFEARGTRPVTLRAGFPVKADLRDVPEPAEFQTSAELVAWPHLGRFHLYRPRQYGSIIETGQAQLELAAADDADGASDADALAAVELKKGDRLALVPEESVAGLLLQVALGWTTTQGYEEIVVIEKVERRLGRVILTLAGRLTHGWPAGCRAWLLGRSFRHFGAGAPPQYVATSGGSSPTTTVSDTPFTRGLKTALAYAPPYMTLDAQTLPLDQEVHDLAAGGAVLVSGSVGLPFAVARTLMAVRAQPARWGNLNAPASFVRLDRALAPEWTDAIAGFPAWADLRTLRLHETRGPALRLRPLARFADGGFAGGTQALHFWGRAAEAKVLAGRRLHLAHGDGRSVELVCTNAPGDFAPQAANDAPRMWPLSFDRPPAPFTRADFDEADPAVTVFGNLADATQGRQEPDAVLGNGDARQGFQTFPLPKAPLTYRLSSGAVPPQVPQLEVWVGGRLWTRVDSLFGLGPKDEAYIVREDAEGRSFVQFGDGERGARLPSGVKNVVARFRTGIGARGPVKPGTTPSSSERPDGFDKVSLAGIVSGGAEPEDLEKAREAAPGKVQGLGRLVSLRDFETETLAIPGVVTATAAWDLYRGVPAVILRVLLEAGREAEFTDVRATLAHAQRCRGPDRFALIVQQALPRHVFLDLAYARDPGRRAEDVEAALRAAAGLAGDKANERSGLFGLRARRLGEREYASRIEGRLQNVPGVLWCRVRALGRFAAGATDPTTLVLPAPPRPRAATLPCAPRELLQLRPAHLVLTPVDEPTAGECA